MVEVTRPDRGTKGAIMDALWPLLGGDMTPADVWHDINAAVAAVIDCAAQSETAAMQARIAELEAALKRIVDNVDSAGGLCVVAGNHIVRARAALGSAKP